MQKKLDTLWSGCIQLQWWVTRFAAGSGIRKRQLNCGLWQQSLVSVSPIRTWVCIISAWKIQRRPSFTLGPRLWLDMKVQDATLEQWRHSLEIWDELLSIGTLLHLLGLILPCIISGHSLKMGLLLKENLWTQLWLPTNLPVVRW